MANHMKNAYDDGNIPDADLPNGEDNIENTQNKYEDIEPLPESSRPRKDGPGGN